jgi:glycosyltransferase involved in cell wall biosynthesis
MPGTPPRVLIVTNLFPNAVDPLLAPFNRQQFAALAGRCHIVDVLATIPWYPGAGLMARWSSAGRMVNVPARETIAGLSVRHPRTLFLPRLAHGTWGPLYAASLAPLLLRYRGAVDVVLAAWAYPDGFGGVVLARMLGVPAVVKLHGSDINHIAHMPGPRRQLRWALPRAARVVAVSRGLADEVAALGVPRERIALVLNGVDRELFHPADRAAARAALGLPVDAAIVLYVGALKASKGVLDLIAAFETLAARRPDAHLVVGGDGELRARVDELAARVPRLHVLGSRPLAEVPRLMAACDVLALASWNEGTPNVVLEALASGRRVVATAVGGVPDLLPDRVLGDLVPPRDPAALAAALERALAAPYDAEAVAAHSGGDGWGASADALARVLADAVAR